MSIPNLPVDFKDDILNTGVNQKRKYQQTYNSDGSVSFEDVTAYQQKGSNFGAQEVNETNGAVNNIYSERILDLDELELVTEPGFFVDAQAVKEAHDSLNSKRTTIYDTPVSGKPTSYTLLESANNYDALEIHIRNNNSYGGVFTVKPSGTSGQYPRSFVLSMLPPSGEGGTDAAIWCQASRFQLSADGMQLNNVRSVQVRIGSNESRDNVVNLFVEKVVGIRY